MDIAGIESRRVSRRRFLRVIGSAFGGSAAATCRGGSDANRESPALLADCERQLALVHEAVMGWHRKRGQFPAVLSDLVNEGAIDDRYLICPVLRQNRRLSTRDPSLKTQLSRESLSLYTYEFASRAGSDIPAKKLLQRQVVGDWIPIVRCGEHDDPASGQGRIMINIGVNGALYRSRVYWEAQFAGVCLTSYLRSSSFLKARGWPLSRHIKARSAALPLDKSLDLSDFYNALIDGSWRLPLPDSGGLTEFLQLLDERSVLAVDGVEYDVRGVLSLDGVGLKGSGLRDKDYDGDYESPRESAVIPCQLKGRSLSVLAGCVFGASRGADAGHLEVGFEGGGTAKLPLIYGGNIASTEALCQGWDGPPSKCVWSHDGAREGHEPLAVFRLLWPPWEMERTVVNVVFRSGASSVSPFLLAVSIS